MGLSLALLFSVMAVSAQNETTSTIKVNGNCGMCQGKIEKAAKSAGANEASWNKEDKTLTVTYASSSTNDAKIQKKVAAAGYDTEDVKASDKAYKKLHACCQYDRNSLELNTMDSNDGKKAKKENCKKENGKSCCSKKEKAD